jgi:S1-C subfamily serine protease
MIASSVGQSAGIGFAIPINTAKAVLNDLVTLGRVRRPALGVKTIPLDPELADQMGLSIDYGLLIVQAIQGGSADQAGLREAPSALTLETCQSCCGDVTSRRRRKSITNRTLLR